ncbi:MAG: hypothetical protein ACYCTE_13000 [Acidimicrobiales bacterium]
MLTGHGPRMRYARAAARHLATDIVNDAIAASHSPAQIAKAVARWGTTRFPDETRAEWANATAMELELAGYGAAARHVTRFTTSMRSVSELLTPPPSSATTRGTIDTVRKLRRLESPAS